MLLSIARISRRMVSTIPTSHYITLPDRPIVQENGEISRSPLQLHYWEWKGHQPTVLICHGGTLHGRCYDRIINEALAGFHVIALDFRGHGRSQKHPLPYPFPWFGEDVLQFIERLDLCKNNLLGIGHSVGGHALVLAAAIASKQLFQSLLLLDPGIYALSFYERGDADMEKFKHMAPRRSQWPSVEDMISSMEQPGRLSTWSKDILRDYCTYALDDNGKLQCTPERAWNLYGRSVNLEANIFKHVQRSRFIHNIRVHVVRAARSELSGRLAVPTTAPNLARWFKKGRDTLLKDANHSFPMEQPDITIQIVKEMIEEYQNTRSHL